jgi:hypothetical protein
MLQVYSGKKQNRFPFCPELRLLFNAIAGCKKAASMIQNVLRRGNTI